MFESIGNAIYNTVISIIVMLIDMLTYLVNLVPVPEFLQNFPNLLQGLPSGVLFFASALQIPQGLALVGSAVTARLIIRLIPFIGSALK